MVDVGGCSCVVDVGGRSCVVNVGGCSCVVDVGGRSCVVVVGWSALNSSQMKSSVKPSNSGSGISSQWHGTRSSQVSISSHDRYPSNFIVAQLIVHRVIEHTNYSVNIEQSSLSHLLVPWANEM